jgi:hypothetical protein
VLNQHRSAVAGRPVSLKMLIGNAGSGRLELLLVEFHLHKNFN